MKKIVINSCHGGFGVSDAAKYALVQKKGITLIPDGEPFIGVQYYENMPAITRDDPDLVAVIEELGPLANGRFARLKVVEIPDDVEWEIDDYDGDEWVAEKHRRWG
jgi:hypothetical protein